MQFHKTGGEDFKIKEFERWHWDSHLALLLVWIPRPAVLRSTEIFTGRMENTFVKGRNNWLNGRVLEHRKHTAPQRDISNFVQTNKMTTFKNTAVDHAELTYTHGLQTAFRNMTMRGLQTLLPQRQERGQEAALPASRSATTSRVWGQGGQAAVQGRDAMKVENSFGRMSVLGLQKCLMIDHCTVHKPFCITTEAAAHRDKQHVEVPGEPSRNHRKERSPKPLTHPQPQPAWFGT